MSRQERPVNLALTKFSFPLPAIASITHRITGVLLFAGIAFGLYVLDLSLASPAGFERAAALLATPAGRVLTWLVLAVLIFHLLAGIRHLLMDFGIGETLRGGRLGAQLTFALSAVLIVLAGVWIW